MDNSDWFALFEPPRRMTGTPLEGVSQSDQGIEAVAFLICGDDLPEGKKGGGQKTGRLPRKNAYFQAVKRGKAPQIVKTTQAERFIRVLESRARELELEVRPSRMGPKKGPEAKEYRAGRPINVGWWALDVLVVSKRRNLSLDVLTPAVDSDSCLSPVKDALQHAGIIDDDARVIHDRTHEAIGSEDAVGIRLYRAKPGDVSRVWGRKFFG